MAIICGTPRRACSLIDQGMATPHHKRKTLREHEGNRNFRRNGKPRALLLPTERLLNADRPTEFSRLIPNCRIKRVMLLEHRSNRGRYLFRIPMAE